MLMCKTGHGGKSVIDGHGVSALRSFKFDTLSKKEDNRAKSSKFLCLCDCNLTK